MNSIIAARRFANYPYQCLEIQREGEDFFRELLDTKSIFLAQGFVSPDDSSIGSEVRILLNPLDRESKTILSPHLLYCPQAAALQIRMDTRKRFLRKGGPLSVPTPAAALRIISEFAHQQRGLWKQYCGG